MCASKEDALVLSLFAGMWVRCALLRGACAEYMYFGSMSANSALRGACAERLCTSTHRSGARQRLGSGAPGSRVLHCREWGFARARRRRRRRRRL